MYNLSNSPAGPLGQAGMASTSTQPPGMFANAPASFNGFGKGINSFTSKFQSMFGDLFGGQGDIAPQAAQGGAPSLFGAPQQGQGAPQVGMPQNPLQGNGAPTNPLQGNGMPSNPMQGSGILSSFMK